MGHAMSMPGINNKSSNSKLNRNINLKIFKNLIKSFDYKNLLKVDIA